MFRAARATTKPSEFSPPVITEATRSPQPRIPAPLSFRPAIRPAETNNPSLVNLCPGPGSHETHNQLAGASLTASSYRPPAKPLAARPFSRPCDLRSPRSIRRGTFEPMPLATPKVAAAQGPQPVVQELHIQLAGANLFCGLADREIHQPHAAETFPGPTATASQNPRAGSFLCVHRFRAIQGTRDTQSSRAHVFGEIRNQIGADIYPRPSTRRNPELVRLGSLGDAQINLEIQAEAGITKP